MTAARLELLRLCNALGEPARDLVLSAEGNVSARDDDPTSGTQRMIIKASGCSLATMTEGDLLLVDRTIISPLLDQGDTTDDITAAAYRASVVDGGTSPRMPSVEAILHAVLYDETSARVIAHTHPTAVNAILCSASPGLLIGGALFPDMIVMLGRRQLLLPYVDPGVPLARAVRDSVRAFIAEEGTPPRVIYLANHGLFVLASSPDEALQITTMVVKVARIITGSLAAGGPAFLPAHHVDRIENRPDEQYRRALLAAAASKEA
jgi:rhamnose utilization protein RhaD (predicted bifunctional aldolase and dehydrogenase)